jgi:hypothetical protein
VAFQTLEAGVAKGPRRAKANAFVGIFFSVAIESLKVPLLFLHLKEGFFKTCKTRFALREEK